MCIVVWYFLHGCSERTGWTEKALKGFHCPILVLFVWMWSTVLCGEVRDCTCGMHPHPFLPFLFLSPFFLSIPPSSLLSAHLPLLSSFFLLPPHLCLPPLPFLHFPAPPLLPFPSPFLPSSSPYPPSLFLSPIICLVSRTLLC